MRMPAPWRGLLLAAALILAGTAILQFTAFQRAVAALHGAGLEESWGAAFTGLWVMFAAHLGLIAGFLAVAALRARMAIDSGLLVCALILAADTALLGGFMGMFVGTLLVGIATALVIIARVVRQVTLAGYS